MNPEYKEHEYQSFGGRCQCRGCTGTATLVVDGWAVLCVTCATAHLNGQALSVLRSKVIGGDARFPTCCGKWTDLPGKQPMFLPGESIG
jgi:hypothetical protein